MANIREIEVNGEKYGIESINDIAVSYNMPSDEVKPGIWLKPSGAYDLQSIIGIEYKAGSTSSYGDYTLDEEGNLIETTDTSSDTGTRCTKMFGLFREREYFLENISYGSGSVSSGQLWTWDVFFYDINHNFLSKASGYLEEGSTYNLGDKVVDFVMPTEARYIRIRYPYSKPYYFSLVDAEANVAVSSEMYGSSYYEDHIYKLDGDHYVMV